MKKAEVTVEVSKVKTVWVFGLGALAGGLAVWGLHQRSATGAGAVADMAPVRVRPASIALGSGTEAHAPRTVRPAPVVPQQPRPAEPASPGDGSAATEVAALQARLARAEAELQDARQRLAANEGAPVSRPEALAPRFAQEALRESLTTALKEAGFADAQVTSMDCTEYPCIAYGEGLGDRADFERLNKTRALEAYRKDSHQAFGFKQGQGEGMPQRRLFGFALVPEDDKNRAREINSRIQYRMRQMQQTFTTP